MLLNALIIHPASGPDKRIKLNDLFTIFVCTAPTGSFRQALSLKGHGRYASVLFDTN